MDKVNIGELFLLFLLLLFLSPLIGRYLAAIFKGDPVVITPLIKPLELFFYRLCGVDPHWHQGIPVAGSQFTKSQPGPHPPEPTA